MPPPLAKSDLISLDLPGCYLSRNSLSIDGPEAFARVGLALALIDSCSQWWWGDYLLYAERNNLKSILDSARADLHRSTIQSYVECARLYAPDDRHADLSFSHHAAVMYILGMEGTVEEAKKWLVRAAAGELTVGELREAMRADKRTGEQDPGPMRGVVRITDFVKISRWAETVHARDLGETEASEIRRSTEPLFAFLCEIHRKPFTINEGVSVKQVS